MLMIMLGLMFYQEELINQFKSTLDWYVDHEIIGISIYIAASSIAVLFFIPGSIFTIGGCYIFGMAYGKLMGFLVAWSTCSIAVCIGA